MLNSQTLDVLQVKEFRIKPLLQPAHVSQRQHTRKWRAPRCPEKSPVLSPVVDPTKPCDIPPIGRPAGSANDVSGIQLLSQMSPVTVIVNIRQVLDPTRPAKRKRFAKRQIHV